MRRLTGPPRGPPRGTQVTDTQGSLWPMPTGCARRSPGRTGRAGSPRNSQPGPVRGVRPTSHLGAGGWTQRQLRPPSGWLGCARGSPRCGKCSDGHETVAHLLFNCRQWRRQREALFKALDEAKIIRPGPTEEAPEARLFADRKATKALLEYIGAITAQRSEQQAAEEALRADCWGIEAMEEGDREGEG
ncbi:hypothetical protein ACJ73_07416 [Blastomyces percursus]|uniref:Uncharacterized protein n=1 Tax=Blastomyces percursus TaxID=1658174 RepID=A0A1J9QZJ1_9EURO|nr:hypothetical protein ACJ73_07416 [Blastomyces percursus]